MTDKRTKMTIDKDERSRELRKLNEALEKFRAKNLNDAVTHDLKPPPDVKK